MPTAHPFRPPQVFLNAFTLTFLAEWGDRSQIATIGLAASSDVFGVTLGSIVGALLSGGGGLAAVFGRGDGGGGGGFGSAWPRPLL